MLDLTAIKARRELVRMFDYEVVAVNGITIDVSPSLDIDALIVEVERLTLENKHLAELVDDYKGADFHDAMEN